MSREIEYNTLRAEILQSIQTAKNYRVISYTITIAILAFAFNQHQALFFLIPFVAIYPLYILFLSEIINTLRIGTYIMVFIESTSKELNWESRLYKYDQTYLPKKAKLNSFSSLCFCCLILSILHLDFTTRTLQFYITILLQIIVLIFGLYLFITKRPDYAQTKRKYIENWQTIKKSDQIKADSTLYP